MANNFSNPNKKSLPIDSDLTKVPTVANSADASDTKEAERVGGMTKKPLLPMASSSVPAVAGSAAKSGTGGETGWLSKANSTVPAIAGSAAKSGRGD